MIPGPALLDKMTGNQLVEMPEIMNFCAIGLLIIAVGTYSFGVCKRFFMSCNLKT
jgi:hypothetical protein